MLTSGSTRPSVFEYENFRKFIKDMIAYRKKQRPAFSYRTLSRDSGISHTLILLVLKGNRNLTKEAAGKLSVGMKLNKEETFFFTCLAMFNQATTGEEKTKHYKQMSHSQKYKNIKSIEVEQYEYFSKWYYSAIRELVTLSFFREDPKWISQVLKPSISPKQAENALHLLIKLNLLRRNAKGQLEPSENTISSGNEVKSTAVMNYHKDSLDRAAYSLESSAPFERDISSLVISAQTSILP